jgi:hypothetical protein
MAETSVLSSVLPYLAVLRSIGGEGREERRATRMVQKRFELFQSTLGPLDQRWYRNVRLLLDEDLNNTAEFLAHTARLLGLWIKAGKTGNVQD